MKLYGGIDLHSNNTVVALLEEADGVICRKRLANEAGGVLEALALYHEAITGLVI
jgi:hypothetical protein